MHIHKRMHIHTTHVFEVRSDESTLLRLAQTMLKCLCKLLQVLRAGTYSGITTSPVKAIRAQGLGRVTHQGSVAIGVKPVEGLFRFVFNLSKTTPPSDPVPADRCHEHHRCMWRPSTPSHVSVAVRVYELGGTGTRRTESARCCEAKAPAPCLGEESGNDIPSHAHDVPSSVLFPCDPLKRTLLPMNPGRSLQE
jgi:hypothetical protein